MFGDAHSASHSYAHSNTVARFFFSNYESCSSFFPVNIIFYSFCASFGWLPTTLRIISVYINISMRFLVHLLLCVAWLAFRARVVFFSAPFFSIWFSLKRPFNFPCNRISSLPISFHFVYIHIYISKWIIYLTWKVFLKACFRFEWFSSHFATHCQWDNNYSHSRSELRIFAIE